MSPLLPLLNRIDQIGLLVPDLAPSVASMERLFGLTPHTQLTSQYRGVRYRGRVVDTAMDVALFDVLGLEVEFIQPMPVADEPQDAWQEFLASGRSGLHHIRFDVADHDAVVAAMAELGIEPVQIGDSMRGGGVRFAYYDTTPLVGFWTETLNPSAAS